VTVWLISKLAYFKILQYVLSFADEVSYSPNSVLFTDLQCYTMLITVIISE